MTWIFLSILSYFLTALVIIVDKFLLSNRVKNPLVYVFYMGILNSAAFILWPFDFAVLGLRTTLAALVSGMSFFLALFFLYSAINKGEVSRVVSVVGGISPIFLLALSYVFLGERLPVLWLISFLVLISGSFLLSLRKDGKIFLYSFIASVFFALTFFAAKLVFLESSFLNGFVWTRIGTLFMALIVFSIPSFRLRITQSPLKIKRRLFLFFVSNKALGAFSFLVLNYAIMLGSVAVVNALQGVQYAFIFILMFIFSFFCPRFIKEPFSLLAVTQKVSGIVLISLGVALLFIA